MSEAVVSMLQQHPFVEEFAAGARREARDTGHRRCASSRDQIIFREGDDATDFYLIVSGLVALEIAAPGHTFRVQTLFAGR